MPSNETLPFTRTYPPNDMDTPHDPIPTSAADLTSLTRAILDCCNEGVVVLDANNAVVYANSVAKPLLEPVLNANGGKDEDVLSLLSRIGGERKDIRVDGAGVVAAVVIPAPGDSVNLRQQERETIIRTLDANGWRLAESASELGISRTTLWRRLRVWGLQPRNKDGRNLVSQG